MAADATLEFVAKVRDEASGPAKELRRDLDRLGGPVDDITAAIKVVGDAAAEAAIKEVAQQTQRLDAETADIKVDADTSAARSELDGLTNKAKSAGAEAGEGAGDNLASGIIDGLQSIPVAGAVVAVGAAIGVALFDGIRDGLQVDAREDLFGARTGLDEATSAKIGQAAGEAYADNFGESIAGNLDAAKNAVRNGLLDPAATQADTESIIASLTGVTDVLEDEVPAVAKAAGQAIKTGLADNATEAFDLFVKGTQAGVNASDDFLDTINEYGTQFRKLGLDGPEAVGLVAQAMRAGARDSDVAADSLKEFAIRAVDGSELTAESFKAVGLSAGDMSAAIARGGPEAAAALDLTLDSLRGIEDPAERARVAVGLFGTQAEDMGDALYAMDLSTAAEQLGVVGGAAEAALERMGGNDASKWESARRNVEVAMDGIKGALAGAFSDEVGGAAEWVARNRAPMMEFILDVINGAFDLGGSFVTGFADASRGVADFIGGPGADLIDSLGDIAIAVDHSLPGDQGAKAFGEWAEDAADGMRRTGVQMTTTADGMEADWTAGLDAMQEKVNTWAAPELIAAQVHDAVIDAQGRLDELSATIDATGGTVTINGNQRNAEETLADVLDNIDESDGTVTINGNKVPAADALSAVIQSVNAGRGNITIGGDAAPAVAVTDRTKSWINSQGGEVRVGANDGPARTTVNAFVREMASRVVDLTITGNSRPINRGQFALGGYTGEGSRYEVAPVDVHRGEYVFDQEATARYRREFEAIAAGVHPAAAFAAAGAVPTGASTRSEVTVRHIVTSPDGSVSRYTAGQIANMLAGDPRAAATVNRAVQGASRATAARTLTATN